MIGKRFALATAAALLASTPALAQDDSLEGVIVQSGNGQIVLQVGPERRTVVFDGDTHIQQTTGALDLRKEDKAASDLLPGLPVKIKAPPAPPRSKRTTSNSRRATTAPRCRSGPARPRRATRSRRPANST
jgi:hypothetical protein